MKLKSLFAAAIAASAVARRSSAFSSRARSCIAARSSSEKVARFALPFSAFFASAIRQG